MGDPAVVTNTLQRLQPPDAATFLQVRADRPPPPQAAPPPPPRRLLISAVLVRLFWYGCSGAAARGTLRPSSASI